MIPEMKLTKHEINFILTWKKFIYISFDSGGNEMIFFFFLIFWLTILQFLMKNSQAETFSFRLYHFGVVFTKHFSPEMTFSFCYHDCNKFHFGLCHVKSCKRLTRNQIKNISFRLKWNLMLQILFDPGCNFLFRKQKVLNYIQSFE